MKKKMCCLCTHLEECGSNIWLNDKIDYQVKRVGENGIVCAVMRDYQYYFIYEEEGKLFKYQITQEEFEQINVWGKDINKIEQIKSRRLGCDKCNEAAVDYQKRDCLIKKGISALKQAELYQCKQCGTYWEYGVYKYSIVDDSYVRKYY